MTSVDFKIQGRSHPTQIDARAPVSSDIAKALRDAGITENANEWTARTEAGDVLDGTKSLIEQGINGPAALILTRGPGRGG